MPFRIPYLDYLEVVLHACSFLLMMLIPVMPHSDTLSTVGWVYIKGFIKEVEMMCHFSHNLVCVVLVSEGVVEWLSTRERERERERE